jgi:quercetin dioxygenase-like cupin family protein
MSIPPGLLARRVTELPRQLWHLGGLMSIRATAGDTDGVLSVVEQRARRGYGTPPHVHSREDETLVVLDGEISYTVSGRDGVLRAGQSAFLPRHRPHRFSVTSDTAHFLVLITPGGFEEMFQVVSSPALEERLPDGDAHTHTDPAVMAAASAALGTTVFRSDAAERARHLHLLTASAAPASYRHLADLITGPLPVPPDAVEALVLAAQRIPSDPGHARALILLGILAETPAATATSAGHPSPASDSSTATATSANNTSPLTQPSAGGPSPASGSSATTAASASDRSPAGGSSAATTADSSGSSTPAHSSPSSSTPAEPSAGHPSPAAGSPPDTVSSPEAAPSLAAISPHDAISARLPEILAAVPAPRPLAVDLALAYLAAHFPAHAEAALAALPDLPAEDLARLSRCLAPVSPDLIGRSWPTPALWELTDAERETDRRWRAEAGWDAATVEAIWTAETTAILAFMGARADHYVERSANV